MDIDIKIPITACNQCSGSMQQLTDIFKEHVQRIYEEFSKKLNHLDASILTIQQQVDKLTTELSDRKIANEIVKIEPIGIDSVTEDTHEVTHEFVGVKPELNPCQSMREGCYEDAPHDDDDDVDDDDDDDDDGGMQSSPDEEADINEDFVVKKLRKSRVASGNHSKACKVCNERIPTRRQLVNHMVNIHGQERPFKCDRCPKEFSDRYSYRKHSETLHRSKTEKRRYYCDVCPKTLSTNSGLIVHKRVHTGEKPYECDICSNQYPQRNSLIHHMRTHTKERPYMCHECSKTFGQRNSFRLHLQAHRGIKPYKCKYDGCEWAFMQKSKLAVHVQSHTGERPAVCPICKKGYTKRYHLRKHIKNFHKIDDIDGVLGPRRKPNDPKPAVPFVPEDVGKNVFLDIVKLE